MQITEPNSWFLLTDENDWDIQEVSEVFLGEEGRIRGLHDHQIYLMGDFRYYTVTEVLCIPVIGYKTTRGILSYLDRYGAALAPSDHDHLDPKMVQARLYEDPALREKECLSLALKVKDALRLPWCYRRDTTCPCPSKS